LSSLNNGKFFLLTGTDSQTHIVYNALTLEEVSNVKLTCKDSNDYDVTYFYSTMLSYDGSYLVGGDGTTRHIFDQQGKFIKSISGRNIYTVFMYGKTSFCGAKNSDETYTKSHLVEVDFISDKETIIYEFETYISTIYLNEDNSGF